MHVHPVRNSAQGRYQVSYLKPLKAGTGLKVMQQASVLCVQGLQLLWQTAGTQSYLVIDVKGSMTACWSSTLMGVQHQR